jgi:DNA-binding response OmpR family regulator
MTALAAYDALMASGDRPVLVVDDDPKIVRLLRTYLERDGHRVVTATDGRAALTAIDDHRPALVVLDRMLPEVDGLAILRAVRSARDRTPILVLSARGATVDRVEGLMAGADDYLAKPFSPSELVLRVRRILERAETGPEQSKETGSASAGPADATAFRLADLELDAGRHEVRVAGRPVGLTPIEFRLLRALLEADGRVLSRDRLLDAIRGADAVEILDRTIDAHVRRLRVRLGDDAVSPRYVRTVRGTGYAAADRPVSTREA